MKTFNELLLENKNEEKLLFFDTEFTGIRQDTTLISIGFVTENDKTFYAEYTDYDKDQVEENEFVKDNVIPNLKYDPANSFVDDNVNAYVVVGDRELILKHFWKWINKLNYSKIKLYSDCLSYDYVLFNSYFSVDNDLKNIHYIPLDLATDLYRANVDVDIDREEFAEIEDNIEKHNSLFDAIVIKKCFDKLNGNK